MEYVRNGCFWCESPTHSAASSNLSNAPPDHLHLGLVPAKPSGCSALPRNPCAGCARSLLVGWKPAAVGSGHTPMVVAGLTSSSGYSNRSSGGTGSETIPLECPGQPAEDARGWWQLQRNLHQTLFKNSHVTYSATIGGVLRPTSSEGGRIQSRVKRGDSKRHVLGVELQRSV